MHQDYKQQYITEEQFESLKPFNKRSHLAEELTGLSSDSYWFKVSIEITRDCNRHGYAVLEAHKR